MRHKLLFLGTFIGLATSVCASPVPKAADSLKVQAVLALGTPYRYGGRSPESGFDCSGLVAHVFERAWGLPLPRNARAQAALGKPIRKLQELQPGDLVFYNTRNRAYSHVGIYIGDGRFVHAPRPGQKVRADSLESPYWRSRFDGGRRLTPPQPTHFENDNVSH